MNTLPFSLYIVNFTYNIHQQPPIHNYTTDQSGFKSDYIKYSNSSGENKTMHELNTRKYYFKQGNLIIK